MVYFRYIMRAIPLLVLSFLSSVSSQTNGCSINQQQVGVSKLQSTQNTNSCSSLIITSSTIECDATTLTVNSIQLNSVSFLCDNLNITATSNVSVSNTTFGVAPTYLTSFLYTYVVYIASSSGSMNINQQLSHEKGKYGMMILSAQTGIQLSSANLTAGNIAVYSPSNIVMSNSTITMLYIFCTDGFSSMSTNAGGATTTTTQGSSYSKAQNALLGNVAVISVDLTLGGEAYYQIVSLSSLATSTQSSGYSLLLNALKYQYSGLIYSEQSVLVENSSNVIGSRLTIFSTSTKIDSTSSLNSTGQGCPANYGFGKGLYFDSLQSCASSGANQASYGGTGLPAINNATNIDDCIYFLSQSRYVLNNQPYSFADIYEGSGGAYRGQTKEFKTLQTEGAGGGFISIYAVNQVAIEGKIEANGNKFTTIIGSGGSGGAILVKSNKINGTGILSAAGGDSDAYGSLDCSECVYNMFYFIMIENNKDRVVKEQVGLFRFTRWTGISMTRKHSSMALSFDSKATGICLHMISMRRHSRRLLLVQAHSQHSYVRLDMNLLKTDSASNAKPAGIRANSLDDASNALSRIRLKNFCDPMNLYIKNVISPYGILYILVYVCIVCLGYITRRLLRMKAKKIDSIPIQHVKYDYGDTDFARECHEIDTFMYKDLLYHKYRLQFYGENSANSNWFLQLRIPEGTEHIFDQREFLDFALKINATLRWKKLDIWMLRILNYLYFPLYWSLLLSVQKKIYRKVRRKIHDEPYPKFLKGSHVVNQGYIRMKITKSDDYSLLYLDLFNYKKKNQKYFKITMPTMIHFSGEGSFLKPYYIWPRDHFLQSVFYSTNSRKVLKRGNPCDVNVFCRNYKYHMHNSQIFENFIQDLNKYSNAIDFQASPAVLIKCFRDLVSMAREFNENFLQFIDLKVHILILEIPFNHLAQYAYAAGIAQNNISTEESLRRLQQLRQLITLIEDQDTVKFEETIKRVQEIKLNHAPIDIKLSLFIFSNGEDLEDLKTSLMPELEIELDSQEPMPHSHKIHQTTHLFPDASNFISQLRSKTSRNFAFSEVPKNQTVLLSHAPVSGQILEPALEQQEQNIADILQQFNEDQSSKMYEMEKQAETQVDRVSVKKKKKVDDPLFKEQPTERTKFESVSTKISIVLGCIRYFVLSHRSSRTDKEILIGSLTSLILLDITCMTFYFNNIYYASTQNFMPYEFILVFIPFPFAIVLSPLLALFLLTNQSYGVGKAFFIFNVMALLTMIISLTLNLFNVGNYGYSIPILSLKAFNIAVKALISQCGTYSLLALNKLNSSNVSRK